MKHNQPKNNNSLFFSSQALSTTPTSIGNFAAALASSTSSTSTSTRFFNPDANAKRSFSADAAAVAPPPEDPSPPPPPTTEAAKPAASSSAFNQQNEDEDEGPDASLTPSEVVARLDRHIVGQPDAKRAVANALRARWRRRRVPEALRTEIVPKNILMIGPTGCGKTEVARRLAKLADAPFVKVEATKFTEVGFHGRDVDSIIRDLVDASVQRARERARDRLRRRIAAAVEERILVALCGEGAGRATVDAFRELYRSGALDERKVAIEMPPGGLLGGMGGGVGGGALGGLGGLGGAAGLFGPGGAAGAGGAAGGAAGTAGGAATGGGRSPLSGIPLDNASGAIAVQEVIMRVDKLLGGSGRGGGGGGRGGGGGSFSSSSDSNRREMRVADARALVEEAEAERLISPEAVAREAVLSAESDGIVFIDEIDKIVVNHETRYGGGGADASSEGVQRDLLPIIEGSVVATKHGNVSTDHMLFICSGAFSACKPSDMLAELQGRLPIRVELKALTGEWFVVGRKERERGGRERSDFFFPENNVFFSPLFVFSPSSSSSSSSLRNKPLQTP